MDEIVAETNARLAEIPPVALNFEEIVVADEAVAMPALPPGPIRRARDAARSAIAVVLGDVPDDPQRYRPHVSIAYVAADGQAEPYVRAVRNTNVERAQAVVNHVDLIEIHRDHRMYEWRALSSIPLGGRSA